MKRGSILNIRDIEQTIDNFNNVPSQSADIKIEPGSNEGESNLVIDIKRTKPWTLITTVSRSVRSGLLSATARMITTRLSNMQ